MRHLGRRRFLAGAGGVLALGLLPERVSAQAALYVAWRAGGLAIETPGGRR